MKEKDLAQIKQEIILALRHPEAEEGLYFRNFCLLHEEDERPSVRGEEVDILDALKELLEEGVVEMSDEGKEAVFSLSPVAAVN